MRRWVGLLGRTSVRGAFGYAKLINHTKVTDESGFWALVGDSEVARGETESESDNRLQPQQSGGGPMPEEVCEAVEACCAGKDSEECVHLAERKANSRLPHLVGERMQRGRGCQTPIPRFEKVGNSQYDAERVPATVGMKTTGHLTRAVFDTYDVTADQDLLDAAGKYEQIVHNARCARSLPRKSLITRSAGMAELADAADSKSADLRVLGVRLPLPAPTPKAHRISG